MQAVMPNASPDTLIRRNDLLARNCRDTDFQNMMAGLNVKAKNMCDSSLTDVQIGHVCTTLLHDTSKKKYISIGAQS